jgi:type IV pilus assembly protein PilV
MSTQPITQLHQRQSGMTLIEVLIAAIVLAIGLLGVAAIQVKALQGAGNAQFRSKATDLTSALADRVRANLDALNSYVTAASTCSTVPATTCSMNPDDPEDGTSNCSPAQMATYNLWDISCQVENALPGGQLNVAQISADCLGCCDALIPLQITVSWQTQSDNASFQTEQVITKIVPGSQIYIPGEAHACVDP